MKKDHTTGAIHFQINCFSLFASHFLFWKTEDFFSLQKFQKKKIANFFVVLSNSFLHHFSSHFLFWFFNFACFASFRLFFSFILLVLLHFACFSSFRLFHFISFHFSFVSFQIFAVSLRCKASKNPLFRFQAKRFLLRNRKRAAHPNSNNVGTCIAGIEYLRMHFHRSWNDELVCADNWGEKGKQHFLKLKALYKKKFDVALYRKTHLLNACPFSNVAKSYFSH
jgi:hypothetical protein